MTLLHSDFIDKLLWEKLSWMKFQSEILDFKKAGKKHSYRTDFGIGKAEGKVLLALDAEKKREKETEREKT